MIDRVPKGIGIEQWVPMSALTDALAIRLRHGKLSKEDLAGILSSYHRGANRSAKTLSHASRILGVTSQPDHVFSSLFPIDIPTDLPAEQLRLIAVASAALRYPAFYHVLVALSKQFNVQPTVSRRYINELVANRYGGNRTTNVGLDAILYMLVESGLLTRESIGMYQRGRTIVSVDSRLCEYWLYADLVLSETKTISVDDMERRPWNSYIGDFSESLEAAIVLKVHTVAGGGVHVTANDA